MNRKLMLVGALALAGMVALSAPASAAVDDLLITGGDGHVVVMVLGDAPDIAAVAPSVNAHEFVVRDFIDPAFADIAMFEKLDFVPMVAIASTAEPDTVACDVSPAAFDTSPDEPMASDQLAPCFGLRHYDPGWRFG